MSRPTGASPPWAYLDRPHEALHFAFVQRRLDRPEDDSQGHVVDRGDAARVNAAAGVNGHGSLPRSLAPARPSVEPTGPHHC